jgi:hypothetical protein
MSFHRFFYGLLPLLLLGCAGPSLEARYLVPARSGLSASPRLSLLHVEGVAEVQSYVFEVLSREAREGRVFQVENRIPDGIGLKRNGNRVELFVSSRGAALRPEELGLYIQVLEWRAGPGLRGMAIARDPVGPRTMPGVPTDEDRQPGTLGFEKRMNWYEGRVGIAVTLVDAEGRVLLDGKTYRSYLERRQSDLRSAERLPSEYPAQVLNLAAREVVREFLQDVTPRSERVRIALDDEDEKQRHLLDQARNGQLPRAMEQLKAYSEQHPGNASALYNLGVMHEASGHPREALEFYDRAIALAPRSLYTRTRQEAARRLASSSVAAP